MYCFLKKRSKCKYWVLKVLCLERQTTHSVCVCSTYQNVVLLVDAMDWDFTYKDLIKKIVCNTESNKCIMYQCESCPGIATLKGFLGEEPNEHEGWEEI